jgi:hypothetical protein
MGEKQAQRHSVRKHPPNTEGTSRLPSFVILGRPECVLMVTYLYLRALDPAIVNDGKYCDKLSFLHSDIELLHCDNIKFPCIWDFSVL